MSAKPGHMQQNRLRSAGACQPSPGACSRMAYGVLGHVGQAVAHAAESLTESRGMSAKPGFMQHNRLRSAGACRPSMGLCSRIVYGHSCHVRLRLQGQRSQVSTAFGNFARYDSRMASRRGFAGHRLACAHGVRGFSTLRFACWRPVRRWSVEMKNRNVVLARKNNILISLSRRPNVTILHLCRPAPGEEPTRKS